MSAVGGIVLRVAETLRFISSGDAVKLAPIPLITPIPGAPDELLGVALHEGEIFPVVSIGQDRHAMVVCAHAGATLGVVGGEVVASGMFQPAREGSGVEYEGVTAERIDLAALYARTSPTSWGGRWLG